MELSKKAAYLKGLMEGMKLDQSKDEVKVLQSVVDLMQNLSNEVEILKNDCCESKELIYEIDEDLGEVEKIVCGCKNEKSELCVNKELCKGHCGHDHSDFDGDYKETDEYLDDDLELDEDASDGNEKYEVLCPNCQKLISLDEGSFEDKEIVCPECGKNLEFDFEGEDGSEKTDW